MPIPVITIAQMREWEKATWAAGQTEAEVIRRVGIEVARHALRLTKPAEMILILAGRGHNGEDARSAHEHLKDRRVDLLDVTDPAKDLPKLDTLLSLRPSLIIDGLFGIGINRPLSSDWIGFIQRVNAAGGRVLAVDVPSGLDADSGQAQGASIEAAVTLTVGAPKLGMLRESAWPFVGRLEVARNVGLVSVDLKSELQWTIPEDFFRFPPARAVAGHKGSYGHLGILAGSVGFHGAAVLTARAAQRAQPGLITLYTSEPIYPVVAAQLQAVMVSPWQPGEPLPESWDAIGIGPGLAAPTLPEQVKDKVRHLWASSPLPLVIDASAQAWLPAGPVPENSLRVITPHPGEAGRMLGETTHAVQADRVGALRRLSERFGCAWVILKGHQTLVGRGTGAICVNPSGNPHLAQGGSGDVLSGYISGLLAQPILRLDPLKTLRYAVWRHGAAADSLQASGQSWVVEDLVSNL